MVIGLWAAYETWRPVGWHNPFVIRLSKYRLGLPSTPLHYGLKWPVEISTVFRPQWQSLYTSLTVGKCMSLELWKGTVKESTSNEIELTHHRAAASARSRRWSDLFISIKLNMVSGFRYSLILIDFVKYRWDILGWMVNSYIWFELYVNCTYIIVCMRKIILQITRVLKGIIFLVWNITCG